VQERRQVSLHRIGTGEEGKPSNKEYTPGGYSSKKIPMPLFYINRDYFFWYNLAP
jgi:hypothetical protein